MSDTFRKVSPMFDTTQNVPTGKLILDTFRKVPNLDTTEHVAIDKWILDTVRKVCNSRSNPVCRNVHTNCGHIQQRAQVSTHPKMTQVTKRFGTHSAKCPDTIKHVAVPQRRNQKSRNWQTNSGHMPQSNSRRVVPHRIQGHHKPNGVKPRCSSNCPRQRTCHSAQNRNRAAQNSRSFRGRFHGHAPRLCRTNSIFAPGATRCPRAVPMPLRTKSTSIVKCVILSEITLH